MAASSNVVNEAPCVRQVGRLFAALCEAISEDCGQWGAMREACRQAVGRPCV